MGIVHSGTVYYSLDDIKESCVSKADLRNLVKRWRKMNETHRDNYGAEYCAGCTDCADDLEQLLDGDE